MVVEAIGVMRHVLQCLVRDNCVQYIGVRNRRYAVNLAHSSFRCGWEYVA